jgi:hypothetical protein
MSLFTCQDDGESPDFPDLKIYLRRFEEEAKKRGHDLDLSNINTIYLDEINVNGQTYCGYGYPNYNGSRRIEISKSSNCNWTARSDIERENLFFHEIGHAFFNRPHDNSKQCDGSPLSIMTSMENLWRIYSPSETEKRAYYISELIDPLVALEKCIDYEKDWSIDSIFYSYTTGDDGWIFDSINGNYIGEQNHSADFLSIASSPAISTDKNGYWFKQFETPNIPECAEVKLKVRINSQQLTGKGAAISVRTYYASLQKEGAQTEEYLYLTTQDNPVTGPLNNHMSELTIPCYSRRITTMIIFLVMMGETKGNITFDDIQVVIKAE